MIFSTLVKMRLRIGNEHIIKWDEQFLGSKLIEQMEKKDRNVKNF